MEIRLIDANRFEVFVCESRCKSKKYMDGFLDGASTVLNAIDNAPTIDPETLPLVKELRATIQSYHLSTQANIDMHVQYVSKIEELERKLTEAIAERDGAISALHRLREEYCCCKRRETKEGAS